MNRNIEMGSLFYPHLSVLKARVWLESFFEGLMYRNMNEWIFHV